MKILHTSDWHLNERQGHVDRQPDIVRRLVEIAGFLDQHKVDVMLVSGDLFSNTVRLDQARSAFADVSRIFRPFLIRGGTMIVIGGNHDSEDLFNMCRTAMDLAAPQEASADKPKLPGRLYLFDRSGYMTLANRSAGLVQFVLLPYPFPSRYLRPDQMNFKTVDERNSIVHQELKNQLERIKAQLVKPEYPTVLVSHLHVRGNRVHSLYHISESQDVIFDPTDLPMEWAYSAFGHIHLPQFIRGSNRAQYAGSIDRFDFSEAADIKSVVLFEIDQSGMKGEPTLLPLNATPLRKIEVHSQAEVDALTTQYPEPQQDIVEMKIIYKPGEDNPDAMRDAVEKIFPRWIERKIEPEGGDFETVSVEGVSAPEDVPGSVRSYLKTQLQNHADRDDLLALAEEMLTQL
ncbi:MAG: exonuclease subunit SbcD [Chloroflexi bacterium]|nr:exonuclease subunit SbcD [Chloroflexota bacterium]